MSVWHSVVPITDEHVFLHLLRAVVLRFYEATGVPDRIINYNPALFARTLKEWNRVPSPYVKIYRKWWKWHVEPTKLGLFYCNHVFQNAKKLECEKVDIIYNREDMKKEFNGVARFKEMVPILLWKYGFESRADYSVKWSVFHGALGRESAPLKTGQTLSIFDYLSTGITTFEEAKKTACMPVKELL